MDIFQSETIQDVDGNLYHTIQICDQVWLVENLRVTHYRNGDPILNVTDESNWYSADEGAYCFYENDASYNEPYGKLYNALTVSDSRNLAPVGFHIPSVGEWAELVTCVSTCVGVCAGSAIKLKVEGSAYWHFFDSIAVGNNLSGFSALPGGCRLGSNADFQSYPMGLFGIWWTNNLDSRKEDMAWALLMSHNSNAAKLNSFNKSYGLSVRCIKDSPIVP